MTYVKAAEYCESAYFQVETFVGGLTIYLGNWASLVSPIQTPYPFLQHRAQLYPVLS